MPLNTEILRDGEELELRWSGFHVVAMVIAASYDSGQGPYEDMDAFKRETDRLMEEQGAIGINPSDMWLMMGYHVIAATPLNGGEYTMQHATLIFHDNADGEEFEIRPGDVLRAWRTYK